MTVAVPPGLQRYRDEERGVSVEFLQPELAGARTVATLHRPVRDAGAIGWVFCHSFGAEQVNLARLEALVARDLAVQGFPVLRYHGRGYGDSQGEIEEVTLTSHLEDAEAAAEVLVAEAGVRAVGFGGARLGGLVAGIAAERAGNEHLALWDPVVEGRVYVEQMLRRRALAAIVTQSRESIQGVKQTLEGGGSIDLAGIRFSARAYREITEASLLSDMKRFRGRALLLGMSATGEPPPEVVVLADHLRSCGADPTVVTIRDRGALARFRPGEDERENMVKVKGLAELTRRVSEETVAWALGSASPAAGPA